MRRPRNESAGDEPAPQNRKNNDEKFRTFRTKTQARRHGAVMTWVRIDDGFPEHPKIARVGAFGAWLQLQALAYCNRNLTDGFVPSNEIRKFSVSGTEIVEDDGRVLTMNFTCEMQGLEIAEMRWTERMISAGLWEPAPGGIRVHDFTCYQPTRAAVEAERAANRERSRRHLKKANKNNPNHNAPAHAVTNAVTHAVNNAVTNAVTNDAPVPIPFPSHPHPIPEKEGTTSSSDLSSKGNGEEIFPHTSDDGGLCFVPASAVADFDDPEHGFGLAEIEAVMKQLEQDTAADPSKRRPKEAAITTARHWIRTALKIRDRDRAKAPAGIVGSHGAGDVFVGEAGSVERAAHLSRIVIHKTETDLEREAEGAKICSGRERDRRPYENELEDCKVLNEICEEKRKAKAEAAP